MDGVDRAILRELQLEGRLPNAILADRVHLSPSPCLRRVKRLEAEGTISGYRAVLDPRKIGLGLRVFTELRVSAHSPQLINDFKDAVAGVDEIISCHVLTGASDLVAEVAVPDLAAFEQLYLHTLLQLPGVAETRSSIVIRTLKDAAPLPIRA
jgi:Lrp/AsnC family leucine-responsive transcriptional regulator